MSFHLSWTSIGSLFMSSQAQGADANPDLLRFLRNELEKELAGLYGMVWGTASPAFLLSYITMVHNREFFIQVLNVRQFDQFDRTQKT